MELLSWGTIRRELEAVARGEEPRIPRSLLFDYLRVYSILAEIFLTEHDDSAQYLEQLYMLRDERTEAAHE